MNSTKASQRQGEMVLIINMSGGKDSVYMMGQLCAKYPTIRKIALYADTGFEHVNPVSAEEWARQRCEQFGVEFNVVKNPNKTYLQMVERRGMFPGAGPRQCTSDLKRGPVETWIRRAVKRGHITERIIMNCVGIRAQESPKRAKQKPLKKHPGMSKAGRIVWNWLPIFRSSLADVIRWHWASNVPLHPVYMPEYHADRQQGSEFKGYLRRFSCRVCIFSTSADIKAIYERDREAFDAVASLEQRINFTMKNGQSLIQIAAAPLNNASQFGSEEEMPCM